MLCQPRPRGQASPYNIMPYRFFGVNNFLVICYSLARIVPYARIVPSVKMVDLLPLGYKLHQVNRPEQKKNFRRPDG